MEGEGEADVVGHVFEALAAVALNHNVADVPAVRDRAAVEGRILAGLPGNDEIIPLEAAGGADQVEAPASPSTTTTRASGAIPSGRSPR